LVKIAVTGKGGVGKTLIAAGLAWSLARSGKKIIAIDADPSPNLGLMLGLSPEQADTIIPLSENAALIEKKTGTAFPGVYNLNFSVEDIVRDYSVRTPAGVHLLVMGMVRQMGSGCTCAANSVIRTLLRHLIVGRDEAVVLDMEAGTEHLGRGTAEGVDIMLVVSDANSRSLDTAGKIARMSQDAGIPRVVLVGNKIENSIRKTTIRRYAKEYGLPVAGYVPFDLTVVQAGITGDSVLGLQPSPALRAIDRIEKSIMKNILAGGSRDTGRER
jgi:CO dehydrogenase maturation factor